MDFSLSHQVITIFNKNKLQREIAGIKDLKNRKCHKPKDVTDNDFQTIWIKISLFGDKGDQLLKSLKTKLKHIFTQDVKFRIRRSTQKASFYTIMKD